LKTSHLKLSNPIGATALISFIALSAWADTPPPPPPMPPPPNAAVVAACKQDMQTLCPNVKPGEGRIAACLKANHRLLSAGCKEAIREHRREHAETPGASPPASPPPPPSAPPPPTY
jgi:Cysteine rich repeat